MLHTLKIVSIQRPAAHASAHTLNSLDMHKYRRTLRPCCPLRIARSRVTCAIGRIEPHATIATQHTHTHAALTLFSLPSAEIRSAHSLEYSKFFSALSMLAMYARYLGSVCSFCSSISTLDESMAAAARAAAATARLCLQSPKHHTPNTSNIRRHVQQAGLQTTSTTTTKTTRDRDRKQGTRPPRDGHKTGNRILVAVAHFGANVSPLQRNVATCQRWNATIVNGSSGRCGIARDGELLSDLRRNADEC